MLIQKMPRIVLWVSLTLVWFWSLTATLGLFVPLEWSTDALRSGYHLIHLFGFPIAIFLAFIASIKKNPEFSRVTVKVIAGVCLPCLMFFFLSISTMCQYDSKTLLLNKNDPRFKIVERSLGCGAWDSDPPNWKCYKTIPVSDYFIYFSKVDPSSLDKTEWE
ncbi:MAG: hypothetical protein ACI9J3_002662 [Parvicellaceae bacterium]|jgi:hypothetical protein